MSHNLVKVVVFADHEILSKHDTLEAAWYARRDLTASVEYPGICRDAEGYQLAIVGAFA